MSQTDSKQILIRDAVPADARAIIETHYDAVHITAAQDYDEAILDDWSARVDDRVELMERKMRENLDGSLMLVAETAGVVIGFGEIVATNNELRAVYVSPKAARMGVGKLLLTELESRALSLGAKLLWMDSSLTAESFYAAQGYIKDGDGVHELRSGRQMKCIKMHKDLKL